MFYSHIQTHILNVEIHLIKTKVHISLIKNRNHIPEHSTADTISHRTLTQRLTSQVAFVPIKKEFLSSNMSITEH